MRLDREKGLFACDYCRGEAEPPMDVDGVQILGETSRPCPVCEGRRLADGMLEKQPLLYCQGCRGMLIPMEKFLSLVEHLRSLRERPAAFLSPRGNHDAERRLACPMCRGRMLNYPYGGGGNVHIESCPACSVLWLDRSELRRIVVAPDPRPVYSNYEAGSEFERT
jgi:Zn-finger nucleic acid-binding protein